jgi:hypothetical protein
VVAATWLFRHDAGVVVGARLDRPALSQWCLQRLGNEPEQVLFEAGYLSQVIGLRLTDGRDVVVKVRALGRSGSSAAVRFSTACRWAGSRLRGCWCRRNGWGNSG